jgi:ribulose-phosphate 3-epimerase
VEEAFPYLEQIDDLMLMSIRPGWSGQELNPDVYPRIEAVREEVDRRGLTVDVEIDGGVKLENAQRAVDAGATVLVSASGIYKAPDKVEAARALAEIASRGPSPLPAREGTA